MADRLKGRVDCDVLLSLAGRTAEPMAQPVPVRSGGFGGAEGLAHFLRSNNFDLLIDATHPFAARISANAAIAARQTGIAAFALRRPAWERQACDRWTSVSTMADAVRALGMTSRNVFLAIGRQEAFQFEQAPQHHYLVRSVDPVTPQLKLPQARYILAAGPFDRADERRLLEDNHIDVIVAKNSGGSAIYGKIAAARDLGIEVVMVERQEAADLQSVGTLADALDRIDHLLSPEMKRGV